MIGKLTIDKASMNISYFLYSVLLVHENSNKISRADFVERMASFIGLPSKVEGNKENRTPYNKSKLPRYFGFIDIDSASNLVITNRGIRLIDCICKNDSLPPSERYYVNPDKRSLFLDLIFESVVFDSFGKNNCGAEQSNTDVEPPKVIFKTISVLGKATAEEICYVLFGLNNGLFDSFAKAIAQIQKNRDSGNNDYSSIMEQWGVTNIVNDCKIINIFTDESIGLLRLVPDEETGRSFYQFSAFLSSEQKKQIESIDAIYQPLRALFYSNDHRSLTNWIKEAVLGRVSDDSYVFYSNGSSPLVGGIPFNKESPALFERALLKAFENLKRNVFLVLENCSESDFPSVFQQYQQLFERINNLQDDFHGWSKSPIVDSEVYNYIVSNCRYVKNILHEGCISIPSNLQIIGVMNMETSTNQDFDYGFKRVLVETTRTPEKTVQHPIDESKRIPGGKNVLLYGVPGSGKSYTIEHELCRSVKKENRYRVVFHPEYMYSDFVGQILPKVIKSVEEDGRDEVTYEFVPGPFTNILKEAYHNPCEKYVLIIEELNRGNAPAIFGEIFQLLDRIGPNSTNKEGYRRGTSEYFINNENIAECVYGEKTHEVRIPSNLTILATMNTSDQNVFTLDTAFQRRWQMRQVDNSFEKVSDSLANKTILDTTVRWEKFCQEVNNQILINASEMSSTEDKRLGVYFVTEEDLSFNELDYSEEEYLFLSKEDYDSLSEPDKNRLEEITEAKNQNRRFPEKVLKYLWDDAFKFNPDRLFKKELRSLEAVISGFLKNKGNARWNILNEAIKGNLIEDDKGRS